MIIATGGTISGAGESSVGSKYASAKLSIDKIMANTQGLDKVANVQAEQLMQLSSQNIDNVTWLKIAKRVNEVLAKSSVDGVVITHGTDTLEETAYFLNLVVKSKKPVVVVGSMRPSTSLSADGAMNLYNAVSLAASDEAVKKGVLVLMNDEIFSARDVSKTNTTNLAAFQSVGFGPLGQIHCGKVQLYYQPLRLHTFASEFNVKKLETLPKVDIIYSYIDQDSSVVDHLVEAGTKAIIVATVGDGNVNDKTLLSLIEAKKKGVTIVMSSRVGAGVVVPNSEIENDELGFLTADNLSPQKARILTMLALTKTADLNAIKTFFGSY